MTRAPFFGWRVVGATFVMAIFAWGLGLYGPSIYLHAVREARGWPLELVSTAVTVHFLTGALVVALLPRLHRRLGLVAATRLAGVLLGIGVLVWALAQAPWQMFVAALLSGAGWGASSAAALNAILSQWFARERSKALSVAYNGASVGGIVAQPVLVTGIAVLGFPVTAALVAAATAIAIWLLAGAFFSRTPDQLGQRPDGDAAGAAIAVATPAGVLPLPGAQLWRDWRFRTLCAGMTLGLFAQTGLLVHLLTHLAPTLGAVTAGWLMTAATVVAMGFRTLGGFMMGTGSDRRVLVSLSFLLQIAGALLLLLAEGASVPLLLAGVLLFGAGVGNAISLPPLIAQVEFVREDVPRVVSVIVATSQATYAFAPAAFGLLIAAAGHPPAAPLLFLGAAALQVLAIAAFLAGRRRS